MPFKRPSKSQVWPRCALTVVIGLLISAFLAAGSAEGTESPMPSTQSAAWVPVDFDFVYYGVTTRYTCDGLREKFRRVLLDLGARPDLQVLNSGCTGLNGPGLFPRIRIKMHVLRPDRERPGAGSQKAQERQEIPIHWEKVNLLAGRSSTDAAADCELFQQVSKNVLPLFATRNIESSFTCVPRQVLTGYTRLQADVPLAGTQPVAAAEPVHP